MGAFAEITLATGRSGNYFLITITNSSGHQLRVAFVDQAGLFGRLYRLKNLAIYKAQSMHRRELHTLCNTHAVVINIRDGDVAAPKHSHINGKKKVEGEPEPKDWVAVVPQARDGSEKSSEGKLHLAMSEASDQVALVRSTFFNVQSIGEAEAFLGQLVKECSTFPSFDPRPLPRAPPTRARYSVPVRLGTNFLIEQAAKTEDDQLRTVEEQVERVIAFYNDEIAPQADESSPLTSDPDSEDEDGSASPSRDRSSPTADTSSSSTNSTSSRFTPIIFSPDIDVHEDAIDLDVSVVQQQFAEGVQALELKASDVASNHKAAQGRIRQLATEMAQGDWREVKGVGVQELVEKRLEAAEKWRGSASDEDKATFYRSVGSFESIIFGDAHWLHRLGLGPNTVVKLLTLFTQPNSPYLDILSFLAFLLRADLYATIHDRVCDPYESVEAALRAILYEANPSGLISNILADAPPALREQLHISPPPRIGARVYTLPTPLDEDKRYLLIAATAGAKMLEEFRQSMGVERERYLAPLSSKALQKQLFNLGRLKKAPPPPATRERGAPTPIALSLAAKLEETAVALRSLAPPALPELEARVNEANRIVRRFSPDAPDVSLGSLAPSPWVVRGGPARFKKAPAPLADEKLYREAKGKAWQKEEPDVDLEDMTEPLPPPPMHPNHVERRAEGIKARTDVVAERAATIPDPLRAALARHGTLTYPDPDPTVRAFDRTVEQHLTLLLNSTLPPLQDLWPLVILREEKNIDLGPLVDRRLSLLFEAIEAAVATGADQEHAEAVLAILKDVPRRQWVTLTLSHAARESGWTIKAARVDRPLWEPIVNFLRSLPHFPRCLAAAGTFDIVRLKSNLLPFLPAASTTSYTPLSLLRFLPSNAEEDAVFRGISELDLLRLDVDWRKCRHAKRALRSMGLWNPISQDDQLKEEAESSEATVGEDSSSADMASALASTLDGRSQGSMSTEFGSPASTAMASQWSSILPSSPSPQSPASTPASTSSSARAARTTSSYKEPEEEEFEPTPKRQKPNDRRAAAKKNLALFG